ncbi:MAG: biopolymer transporter ExbD [bacterium]|nr:biopolymer transporter ExbD [bacterium]
MKLKKTRASDEIPTSSMADIAFLLIVYFMITTSFAATRGLDFSLPKDDDTPPIVEKEDSVLIEIMAGGQLVVDTKPMEADQILEYLLPKLKVNPKKPVIIKTMPAASYGHMVEVFDLLRRGKDELELKEDINISIPTQREIDTFWF